MEDDFMKAPVLFNRSPIGHLLGEWLNTTGFYGLMRMNFQVTNLKIG